MKSIKNTIKKQFKGDQEKVFQQFTNWLTLKDESIFLLKGYAGTGKTFMTYFACDHCENLGLTVGLSATTHKAVQKLSESTETLEVNTIHSRIGMMRVYNDDEIAFVKNPYKENQIAFVDVLFLDEVSQLNEYMYQYILSQSASTKIVLIGDGFQIPPVKEDKSLVFRSKFSHAVIQGTLQEIIRQGKGNPIIEESMYVRENYSFSYESDVVEQKGIFFISNKQQLIKAFFKPGIKVVSYRRETTHILNLIKKRYIKTSEDMTELLVDFFSVFKGLNVAGLKKWKRKNIHFKDVLTEGDKIISTNSVSIEGINIIRNSEDFTIKALEETTHNIFFDVEGEALINEEIPIYRLQLISDTRVGAIEVSTPKDKKGFNKILSTLSTLAKGLDEDVADEKELKKKIWNYYWKLREGFLLYEYGYCLNVHRAQGSTYKNVLFLDRDINKHRSDYANLIYTGITRASDLCIVY